MSTACTHAAGLPSFTPPRDVCETCVEQGSEWVHLRQCLTCHRTLCCNDSPKQHMTHHWEETGHPVMRSVEPGETWVWCFVDEATIRETADGWETYHPFIVRGTELAAEHLAAGGSVDPGQDTVADDGFPLGDWFGYVREAHANNKLDRHDVAAIEAIPGWRW
jgi:hypothetical protein